MNVAPDFEPASCLGRRSLVALMIMGLALATLTAAEPGRIIAQHEIREGFIAVTGGKVWFRIIGAGKPGLPLLTLHGGPGGTSEPFEALAPLADERPLVLYDQLGSGRSDRPADNSPYTIERYVEELVQVRAALGLTRIHLLGHSWGTMLAIDYLLTRKPTGLSCLILAGPALSASRWVADQKAYLAQMPKDVQDTVAKHEAAGSYDAPEYQAATMAFYKRHLLRGEKWPQSMRPEAFGDAVYKFMWGPSEFTVTGTLKNYERADRLREIRLPTLFTCGEFDEATPASAAFFQGKLPGAKLKVIPNASHMTYLEQPAAYCAAVREFLHEVEKR